MLDNLVFILAVHRLGSVLGAQVLGRVFSVTFNYSMVRRSVFYSHQRHQSVLPKYLALTAVSGACSYAGIEFLSRRFAVPVVAAKLAVETILFFVNFAVQRLFIFRPREGAAPHGARPPGAPLHPAAVALGVAFLALLGLEVYGFRTAHLFAQEIWYPVGIKRFERFAEIYAAMAALLLLAAPRFLGAFFAVLLLVLTAVSVGPLALLATAFFLLAASSLGSRLLGRGKEAGVPGKPGFGLPGWKDESIEHQLCATLLGVAVYIFLMTLAARAPVHYAALWLALLAAPVLLDFAGVRRRLRALAHAGCRPRALPPRCRRPRPAHFRSHRAVVRGAQARNRRRWPGHAPGHPHEYRRPSRAHVPARALYLVGDAHGGRFRLLHRLHPRRRVRRRACWISPCCWRRWRCCTARCAAGWRPAPACLLAASFAATPIVQLVTGSLFVENVLAALLLGMMAAIWRFGETAGRRYFFAAMALAGAAMSVKFGALAFVAVAVPLAFAEARRHWKALGPHPARRLPGRRRAAGLHRGPGLPHRLRQDRQSAVPVSQRRNSIRPCCRPAPISAMRASTSRSPGACRTT